MDEEFEGTMRQVEGMHRLAYRMLSQLLGHNINPNYRMTVKKIYSDFKS
jgi:hypothetical protein